MDPVEQFYDQNVLREWQRFEHHRMEFAITLRALDEYLPAAPAKIIDIGSGPGRYAIVLAQKGYELTLLDISQRSLNFAERKARAAGVQFKGVVHGNAIDLPALPEPAYDVVLMLGPLYHLLRLRERIQAIREANRILKPGGLILAAFITRYAPLRDAIVNRPEWLANNPNRYREILDDGLNLTRQESQFSNAYFAHPKEVVPFMEVGGFQEETTIGCEGIVSGHEAEINKLIGPAWDFWVDVNYRLGKDSSTHGASDHLLYIGHKK